MPTATTNKTTKELLDTVGILKPELWEEDGRWITPALPWSFFAHWHQAKLVRQLYPSQQLRTIFSVHGYAFWHVESRNAIYSDLEKRQKEGTMQELVDAIDAGGRAIFAKVLGELAHDDSYIEKNIASIFDLYKEFIGTWTISTALGDQMTRLAKSVGYISSDAELFAKVHPHLRTTWIEQEVERVLEMAKLFVQKYPDHPHTTASLQGIVSTDEELQDLSAKCVDDFLWCRVSKWIGDPVDLTYAYKRLSEEIENYKQGNHSKVHRKEETDRSLDGIIAMSVCSAYWRAQSAMIEMKMALRMRPILVSVADKNQLSYKQIVQLSCKELVEVIQSKNKIVPDKSLLLEREKEFFNSATDDSEEIILTALDPEYATIKNLYIKKADDSHLKTGMLKGIGASLGTVTGIVRVIHSGKDFGNFKEGEILVAAETSPTFVPLMRASLAILTGKGGITSHAAIVSRELGKPCIIAIKDVTKILKDGDRVEVDAGKGTVKILAK